METVNAQNRFSSLTAILLMLAVVGGAYLLTGQNNGQVPPDMNTKILEQPTPAEERTSDIPAESAQNTSAQKECSPPPPDAVTLGAKSNETIKFSDATYVKEHRNTPNVDTTGFFDESCWVIVNSETANFSGETMHVLLLSSKYPTGLNGVGGAAYDANLLIMSGKNILYRLSTTTPSFSYQHSSDFISSNLAIGDVTNDVIPEIIFSTGSHGASDFYSTLHILRYNHENKNFSDISHEQFYKSGLDDVFWFTLNGRTYAVATDGVWGENEGHYSPHFYEFSVYTWSNFDNSFVSVKSVTSQEKYSSATEAFNANEQLIKSGF